MSQKYAPKKYKMLRHKPRRHKTKRHCDDCGAPIKRANIQDHRKDATALYCHQCNGRHNGTKNFEISRTHTYNKLKEILDCAPL